MSSGSPEKYKILFFLKAKIIIGCLEQFYFNDVSLVHGGVIDISVKRIKNQYGIWVSKLHVLSNPYFM